MRSTPQQLVRQLAAEFGVTPSSRANTSSTRAAPASEGDRERKKEKYFGAQA